jgi:NAD(P)-dependent dehydrogenase (short-subunit alcohol dehydrogenase family)
MYGAAKAGMEHLVQTWAQEVARTPLRVNLADPGIVATKMRALAFPGEDPATIAQPASVAPGLAALCLPSETRNGARVALSAPPA